MAIQLSTITIQVKHNSSGILNAGVSVREHTVETATHTMKTVTGIHVLRLHADMPHFKISTIRLVIQSERPFVYVVCEYQKKQYHGG